MQMFSAISHQPGVRTPARRAESVVPRDDFTSRQGTFSAGRVFSEASMRAERLREERIAPFFGKRKLQLSALKDILAQVLVLDEGIEDLVDVGPVDDDFHSRELGGVEGDLLHHLFHDGVKPPGADVL